MADEATTQTGASETDPAGSGEPTPGTANDGGTSVTDSGATEQLLAQERAKAEQTARELQASRDRERAAREKAEKELAKLRGNSGETPQALTEDRLLSLLDERERRAALKQAAETFQGAEEYAHADTSILARATEFDSVEALRAALESSHTEAKTRIDSAVEAQVRAKLEEAGKQYGISLAPTTPTPPNTTGDPSIEEINSTPMVEWDSKGWTDEVVDRVIRNAS